MFMYYFRAKPDTWRKAEDISETYGRLDPKLMEVISKDASDLIEHYKTSDEFFYSQEFRKMFKRYILRGFTCEWKINSKTIRAQFEVAVTFFTFEVVSIEFIGLLNDASADEIIIVAQSIDNNQINIDSSTLHPEIKRIFETMNIDLSSKLSFSVIADVYANYILSLINRGEKRAHREIIRCRSIPGKYYLIHIYDERVLGGFKSLLNIISSDSKPELLKALYGLLYLDENWRDTDIEAQKNYYSNSTGQLWRRIS